MRRRAARIDANQPTIVKALRDVPGCVVRSLGACGDGVPDLLVGFRGVNYLLEVKDPAQPPSGRHLTPEQKVFFATWPGPVSRVETIKDALAAIGVQS